MTTPEDPTAAAIAAYRALTLTMPAPTVIGLAALVQLAIAEPDLPPTVRAFGVAFLAQVRTYFRDCPEALALLTRGDEAVDLYRTLRSPRPPPESPP